MAKKATGWHIRITGNAEKPNIKVYDGGRMVADQLPALESAWQLIGFMKPSALEPDEPEEKKK